MHVMFKGPLSLVQQVWDKILFGLVTGEFKESDMLAGVRLNDKCREGNEIWRLEVWTKIADEHNPIM